MSLYLPQPTDLATDKQVSYLRSLLLSREVPAYEPVSADRMIQYLDDRKITKGVASQWIQFMLDQPEGAKLPTDAADFPNVLAGRYALVDTSTLALSDMKPKIDFYQIDRPTTGRSAGRLFVKMIHGDDETLVKDTARRSLILGQIAENPEEASARYGHEIGRCGICSRTLTNPVSIERGIGPVCFEKTGW